MRRTSLLVAMLAGSGFTSTLTGMVKLSSGSGLSGVVVSLAKTGGSATTDAQGSWSLATSGILSRTTRPATASSHLSVNDGRLVLAYDGFRPDGRIATPAQGPTETNIVAARSAATAIDTLRFSIGGAIKARLAIGSLDSTGIVTVIDTATGEVDPGTTTTTWATGCSTTKPACTAGTWSTPPSGEAGYKLIKESAHFVIYSNETVTDADATSALNTLETVVWTNLFETNLLMPEPYCKTATKYKAAIHVNSANGLSGGGWDKYIGMWIAQGALKDHWGLTHEFTHAWQTNSPGGGGNFYESHANYTPHQLPEYKNDVHCTEMSANTPHLGLGNNQDRYCNWQFMEYLKDKYCPEATNAIWNGGPDPFTNIQKGRGWTITQLNDFFGEWAMHNVTWDYKATPDAFRASYGNITLTDRGERMNRLMRLEALDDSWATNRRFVSPYYGAPQRFGYNVVRLYPKAGASTVSVTFRGINQTGSNADFRWGLVATDAAFKTSRYSAMRSGLDAKVTFKVVAGEPLFLVTIATPSPYQSLGTDYNNAWRFPYMIELANAWPQGFQNGARDACPTGLVKHPNGGGCAPSSTPTTVYVGPYAKVLAGGKVSGNARIEDQAIIINGSVSGGVVGGLSLVGETGSQWGNNAFNVSGSATVRTVFYPLGFFEAGQGVSGTANLFGDVEFRETDNVRSSGNMSGFVDKTTTAASATDKNSKGPWTWRP